MQINFAAVHVEALLVLAEAATECTGGAFQLGMFDSLTLATSDPYAASPQG